MGVRGNSVAYATADGRQIGYMRWKTGMSDGSNGEIAIVYVDPAWRRKGVATQMLNTAREKDPQIHHSESLSISGRAFAKARPIGE